MMSYAGESVRKMVSFFFQAAVGMLAEDGSKFGVALIFTALPESIVILGALPLFL